MSKVIALFIGLVAIFTMSCSSGGGMTLTGGNIKDIIVGTWVDDSAYDWNFNEDGTISGVSTSRYGSNRFEGKWGVAGTKLAISIGRGQSYQRLVSDVSISSDRKTLILSGELTAWLSRH